MKISEQVYEGKTPSKNIIRSDTNRDIHVRKRKGWEDYSPTNPEKGRAVNHTTKMHSLWPIIRPMQGKCACCMSLVTPIRSVKYLSNTPKLTPHSIHINISNPTLAVKQRVVILTSTTEASRSQRLRSIVILSPRKRRKTG